MCCNYDTNGTSGPQEEPKTDKNNHPESTLLFNSFSGAQISENDCQNTSFGNTLFHVVLPRFTPDSKVSLRIPKITPKVSTGLQNSASGTQHRTQKQLSSLKIDSQIYRCESLFESRILTLVLKRLKSHGAAVSRSALNREMDTHASFHRARRLYTPMAGHGNCNGCKMASKVLLKTIITSHAAIYCSGQYYRVH